MKGKISHPTDHRVDEHEEESVASDALTSVTAERDEYKAKLLRALADYHNLEKRMLDERQEVGKRAVQNFVLRLLPFLDNLEQAEVFVQDKGLALIKNSFIDLLSKEGMKRIEVLGKEYDVQVAEAVDLVEGERDNVVVEVVRNGYEYQGQVIRPAQVKVSKKIS